MNLKVNEIFYSLQGEGGRTGQASIFIRLSGCNLYCDYCDTDHESGNYMSLNEIQEIISRYPCRWIIWTGGEPTLQLSEEVVRYFKDHDYKQAIESNGLMPFPANLDYTVCSPKGANPVYARKMNPVVNEVRVLLRKGDFPLPVIEYPEADTYYISPVFENELYLTWHNVAYCTDFIKQNPEWRLSLQMHKLINIL